MIQTIASSALPVDETLTIKKNSLSAGTSGKRFCVVTGTHGDELEGQLVCYELVRTIRENLQWLDGTVEVYPALNPLGIDSIERGIPNFDLDMNRIFPGSLDGSMAENIAYRIVEDLSGADIVIDIHSSNLYLRETPQVRINVNDRDTLVPLARHLGVDFIWIHDAATVLEATLAHSLNSKGTRCIVVELGVGQRINHKMCNNLTKGIFNLMRQVGVWHGPVDTDSVPVPIVAEGPCVTFLNASTSGIFITDLKTGVIVQSGDLIGHIVSPLTGEVLSEVISPVHGFLFTIRAYPVVYEGSLMGRIYNL